MQEAFILVIMPAAGARHRHRRRLQDVCRGPPRPRACRRSRRRPTSWSPRANQEPGLTSRVHAVQHPHAQDLRRHRPGQGRDAGRAGRAACSRRSRSISARSYVNDFNYLGRTFRVHRPGRWPVPPARCATSRNLKTRNDRGDDGAARLGRDLPRHHRPLPRAALQPLSGGRGPGRDRCPASRPARRSRPWSAGGRGAAGRLRLRVDRARLPGEARRQHGAATSSSPRSCSCSCSWPPSTRAGCCRWR